MRTLIFVNDSPHIDGVLQCSAQIIAKSSAESTIMMVIPVNQSDKIQQAEMILSQSLDQMGTNKLQKKVRIGDPVKEILNETNGENYELLILGYLSPQRSNCLNPKSIFAQIVEGVPCSTLIVRGRKPKFNRILLCDSGSASAQSIRDFMAQLAGLVEGQEQITVLHVMSQISAGPGIRGEELRSDAEELISAHSPEGDLLERDIQELKQTGVYPAPKVRHGLVVDEILEEARNGDYDLVIIGAYRPVGWQRFLLDNLARKIVSHIDRSILIVKPKMSS
jgi:nucleotide-binding universal stress UspA family protein